MRFKIRWYFEQVQHSTDDFSYISMYSTWDLIKSKEHHAFFNRIKDGGCKEYFDENLRVDIYAYDDKWAAQQIYNRYKIKAA